MSVNECRCSAGGKGMAEGESGDDVAFPPHFRVFTTTPLAFHASKTPVQEVSCRLVGVGVVGIESAVVGCC